MKYSEDAEGAGTASEIMKSGARSNITLISTPIWVSFRSGKDSSELMLFQELSVFPKIVRFKLILWGPFAKPITQLLSGHFDSF